jgi:hypothetical protein
MLAWTFLLMHSIIPHNHMHGSHTGCQELLHKHTTVNEDSDLTLSFNSQCEGSNVCHFSGLLFNQDNQDNLLFSSKKDTYCYHLQLSKAVFISTTVNYVFDSYRGTYSLRAPPAG